MSRRVAVRERQKITNIPPEQNIFLGSGDGQLDFADGGRGHEMMWQKTGRPVDMGKLELATIMSQNAADLS